MQIVEEKECTKLSNQKKEESMMDQQEIGMNEFKLQLWKDKLDQYSFLSDYQRRQVLELWRWYRDDVKFLYEIHEAILTNQVRLEDKENQVIYERRGSIFRLTLEEEVVELKEEEILELVHAAIDILETTLPLGSVVTLKQEYREQENREGIQNQKVIITQRFLRMDTENVYFPYAGTVYPLGNIEGSQVIYFTASLIDQVVHTGYRDEEENQVVYLYKDEYIVEKKMHSYGFASEEEIKVLQERVKQHAQG